MNNKAHLRPKDFDSNGDIIPMGWKEEKGDLISRSELVKALNEAQVEFDEYYKGLGKAKVITDNAPTVEYPQETRVPKSEGTVSFKVIDKKTGKEPIFDHNHLFKQKWFKDSNLIWCDIEGWFIGEDGCLILADECGNFVYAPMDRYVPILERPQGEWLIEGGTTLHYVCSECGCAGDVWDKFCKHCGADMRKGGAE